MSWVPSIEASSATSTSDLTFNCLRHAWRVLRNSAARFRVAIMNETSDVNLWPLLTASFWTEIDRHRRGRSSFLLLVM